MSKTDILNNIAEETRIAAAQLETASYCQAADTMLADFQAMSVEARRGRWSELDAVARQQLAWAIVRKHEGLTWAAAPDFDKIEHCLETLEQRFGFTGSEAAVLGALDDAENRAAIEQANAIIRGDLEDVKFFGSERAAAGRARRIFLAGIRAEQQVDGSWRVRSEESTVVYTLSRDGTCTCTAARKGLVCKHTLLVACTETGLDNLNTFDDYDPEPEYLEAAAAALGSRLAIARRQLLEVA